MQKRERYFPKGLGLWNFSQSLFLWGFCFASVPKTKIRLRERKEVFFKDKTKAMTTTTTSRFFFNMISKLPFFRSDKIVSIFFRWKFIEIVVKTVQSIFLKSLSLINLQPLPRQPRSLFPTPRKQSEGLKKILSAGELVHTHKQKCLSQNKLKSLFIFNWSRKRKLRKSNKKTLLVAFDCATFSCDKKLFRILWYPHWKGLSVSNSTDPWKPRC